MLLRMTLPPPPPARWRARPSVSDLIAAGERSISFEFFPPKDEQGERLLWTTLRELEALQPTFVSVTYGAGGSHPRPDHPAHRGHRLADHAHPDGAPHLVGHSRDELRSVIGSYAAAGVRNVLAHARRPAGRAPARPGRRPRTG